MGGIVDAVFGSEPSAPDPTQTSEAQMDINRDALYTSSNINAMDQFGPGFNVSYSGTPENRSVNYSLTGDRQRLADMMNQGSIDSIYQMNQYQPANSAEYGQKASDAAYEALASRLGNFQDKRFDRTENMLTQRGLPDTGEAFGNEMDDLMRLETDEQLQIAAAADKIGMDKANQMFGQDQMQQQNLRQQLAQMMGLNPENTVQMPGQPGLQMSPADLMGAENNAYNAEMSSYNAGIGGLSNLGGSAMMAYALSNPAFKEDHREVGDILPRIDLLDVMAWKYKHGFADGGSAGFHIGPYADQFKQLFGIGDGVTINMMDAVGILFKAVKELNYKIHQINPEVS